MAVFYVEGITPTAVPNNDAFAQLWNPAGARRVRLLEVAWGMRGNFDAGLQARLTLQRTSARGATPNNTVTPGASNSGGDDAGPNSAAVMDMGPFGTDPTFTVALMSLLVNQNASANQQPYFTVPIPRGIAVPPGTGVAIRFNIASGSYPTTGATMVFED